MRAAFGFLVIVIVLAIGLSLGKKQLQTVPPVAAPASAASAPVTEAVGQQVQGALEAAAAQRASEAQP